MATLMQKARLLRGLYTGEKAYGGPIFTTVDITRRCNLRCLGCRYHSPLFNIPTPGNRTVQDIPFSLFKKACEELRAMGTAELVLTGEGEPLLHPRIFDLISTAKRMGFKVTLFTNGTLLDEAKVRALIESRLDTVMVSLWSCSPEEYEYNYPGTNPDYFQKVVSGLKLLSTMEREQKANLPSVVLYHPINHYNHEKISRMVELANETGCRALNFSPFVDYRGKLAPYAVSPVEEKRLCDTLVQIKKQLTSLSLKQNIDETLLRYRIGEAVWDKLPCYVAWFHARIKVDGTVVPCGQYAFSLGSLEQSRFREIWNGEAFRVFRKQALSRKGLTSIAKTCECGFCCFVKDNVRVHRVWRRLSPFRSQA
jgi:MoaA/NifB/PqqE/SkfB family radical SAM enzyme